MEGASFESSRTDISVHSLSLSFLLSGLIPNLNVERDFLAGNHLRGGPEHADQLQVVAVGPLVDGRRGKLGHRLDVRARHVRVVLAAVHMLLLLLARNPPAAGLLAGQVLLVRFSGIGRSHREALGVDEAFRRKLVAGGLRQHLDVAEIERGRRRESGQTGGIVRAASLRAVGEGHLNPGVVSPRPGHTLHGTHDTSI